MSPSDQRRPAPAPAPPERSAVLGAGTMGRGIAQLLAGAGGRVVLIDPDPAALHAAREALADVFEMLAAKGRLAETPAGVLGRLSFATGPEAARECCWAFEAAPEDLPLKRELFARVRAAAPAAYLATNTSTLSVTAIAAAVARPERVVGLHFFNPAPLMALVEVVPGAHTSPETTAAAVRVARSLGRTPVVARDRPGFIVNRVARPFYGEALRLAGEGVAFASVDGAARGAGFPMGPFELLDLIGLDVNLAATRTVYEAFFHEPRFRPHPLQQALVTAGRLGRKSGRGFYAYGGDGDGPAAAAAAPSPAPGAGHAPVVVLGDGAVARHLRARLPQAAPAHEATLVFDARVELARQEVPAALADIPLASLCWAHSASRAQRHHRRSVVGFSLVPAGLEAPCIELFAPEGADAGDAVGAQEGVRRGARDGTPGGALEHAARVLASHGVVAVPLPDRAGGVALRLVALLVNEALSALEEGLATADAIDTAMRLGTRYPLGPLAWGEALGLADLELALRGLYAETLAARFAPRPLLTRLAAVGASVPRHDEHGTGEPAAGAP